MSKQLPDNACMSTRVPTTAKAALRREIRARRRANATERDRAADAEAIAAAVLAALPPGATTVAAYEALPTEPPTDALVRALVARGIRVLLPVLLPDNDLDWRVEDGGPAGRQGARLGPGGIAAADLVVAPALAVDRRGVRLGQGGGSYDRALARRAASAPVVAVVNDDEYVAQPLPHEPHDAAVHAVVTPALGYVAVATPGAR